KKGRRAKNGNTNNPSSSPSRVSLSMGSSVLPPPFSSPFSPYLLSLSSLATLPSIPLSSLLFSSLSGFSINLFALLTRYVKGKTSPPLPPPPFLSLLLAVCQSGCECARRVKIHGEKRERKEKRERRKEKRRKEALLKQENESVEDIDNEKNETTGKVNNDSFESADCLVIRDFSKSDKKSNLIGVNDKINDLIEKIDSKLINIKKNGKSFDTTVSNEISELDRTFADIESLVSAHKSEEAADSQDSKNISTELPTKLSQLRSILGYRTNTCVSMHSESVSFLSSLMSSLSSLSCIISSQMSACQEVNDEDEDSFDEYEYSLYEDEEEGKEEGKEEQGDMKGEQSPRKKGKKMKKRKRKRRVWDDTLFTTAPSSLPSFIPTLTHSGIGITSPQAILESGSSTSPSSSLLSGGVEPSPGANRSSKKRSASGDVYDSGVYPRRSIHNLNSSSSIHPHTIQSHVVSPHSAGMVLSASGYSSNHRHSLSSSLPIGGQYSHSHTSFRHLHPGASSPSLFVGYSGESHSLATRLMNSHAKVVKGEEKRRRLIRELREERMKVIRVKRECEEERKDWVKERKSLETELKMLRSTLALNGLGNELTTYSNAMSSSLKLKTSPVKSPYSHRKKVSIGESVLKGVSPAIGFGSYSHSLAFQHSPATSLDIPHDNQEDKAAIVGWDVDVTPEHQGNLHHATPGNSGALHHSKIPAMAHSPSLSLLLRSAEQERKHQASIRSSSCSPPPSPSPTLLAKLASLNNTYNERKRAVETVKHQLDETEKSLFDAEDRLLDLERTLRQEEASDDQPSSTSDSSDEFLSMLTQGAATTTSIPTSTESIGSSPSDGTGETFDGESVELLDDTTQQQVHLAATSPSVMLAQRLREQRRRLRALKKEQELDTKRAQAQLDSNRLTNMRCEVETLRAKVTRLKSVYKETIGTTKEIRGEIKRVRESIRREEEEERKRRERERYLREEEERREEERREEERREEEIEKKEGEVKYTHVSEPEEISHSVDEEEEEEEEEQEQEQEQEEEEKGELQQSELLIEMNKKDEELKHLKSLVDSLRISQISKNRTSENGDISSKDDVIGSSSKEAGKTFDSEIAQFIAHSEVVSKEKEESIKSLR
ncbi:hypothetical protein ADUPG1_009560, partial [Aduncisulcus paluster]